MTKQPALFLGGDSHLNPRFVRYSVSAPYYDFHIDARAKPIDDRQEPIESEPPEVRIADAREVSRRNSSAAVRSANAQPVAVESLDNFSGQHGFELLGIRILLPEVTEHIAAAPNHFQLFGFHRKIAFNLFRRFVQSAQTG